MAADVELLTIDRDASSYAALPPDTWTIAFGWFMHPVFEMRYDFPLHPNLRPFFVSFHCSKRELLTQEAIDYLGRYAPIGCRDWTTVDVLLSVGVPAFFSGCLTTTVSTVFPDIPERPAPGAEVAYVDVPADRVPPGAPTYLHSDDAIRFRSFTTNMYDAVDLLETYRREHPGLVTSRLHCYLPARSLGVPVDFQPKNRSDPRFAGLIDITDAEFRRIRDTISEKLRDGPHRGLLGRVARRGLRPVARDQRGRRGRRPATARRARPDSVGPRRPRHRGRPDRGPAPVRPGDCSRRRVRAGRSREPEPARGDPPLARQPRDPTGVRPHRHSTAARGGPRGPKAPGPRGRRRDPGHQPSRCCAAPRGRREADPPRHRPAVAAPAPSARRASGPAPRRRPRAR